MNIAKHGRSTDFQSYVTVAELIRMYSSMVLIRSFEQKVEELSATGKLKTDYHLSIGQEAIPIGIISALRSEDIVVSNFRGHGHALAKGVPPRLVMAELFGRSTGTCKGLGGSMHCAKFPELNISYATAIVGAGIPIAAGMALANQVRNQKRVTVVFFGDGAVNAGAFHEGLNMAAIWRLPLILVCENNQYAISTASDEITAGESIAHRAQSYGINGAVVDGNDVLAVHAAAKEVVGSARNGEGPSLLECRTFRIATHSVREKHSAIPRDKLNEWKRRDPIQKTKEIILSRGGDPNELDKIEISIQLEIHHAVKFAEQSPVLDIDDAGQFV